MRMMTGAILVLASVVMFSLYGFEPEIIKGQRWVEWYAYAIGLIGWLFMAWGFVRDMLASSWKHRRHKGDT